MPNNNITARRGKVHESLELQCVFWTPEQARARAAKLIAAADEADSVPRFDDSDIKEICLVVGDRWEHYLDTVNKLRKLRKPRES